MKTFVSANTLSSDQTIAENALQIMHIIEAHNPNLHQLGYEKQIVSTNSMLASFEKASNKQLIDSLVGVSDCVAQLKTSSANVVALYQKSKEEEASKEQIVAASTQMKTVRDIFNNELLPYLEVMTKVKAEDYQQINGVILEYVETINTKARARKTRNANHEELT
jgi:hypothetical protein